MPGLFVPQNAHMGFPLYRSAPLGKSIRFSYLHIFRYAPARFIEFFSADKGKKQKNSRIGVCMRNPQANYILLFVLRYMRFYISFKASKIAAMFSTGVFA